MTAVNLTFERKQAVIVTDCLRVGRGVAPMVTKCHVLPSMRLVVAVSGQVLITQEAIFALISRQHGADDLDAVDKWMPELLRCICQRHGALVDEHPGMVYLIGESHTARGIGAFSYTGPGWESARLEPGICYIAPSADVQPPDEPVAPITAQEDSSEPVGGLWSSTWADRVATVVGYFGRQRRMFPDTIGERLQITHLTTTSVRQWFPRRLGTIHDIEAAVSGQAE